MSVKTVVKHFKHHTDTWLIAKMCENKIMSCLHDGVSPQTTARVLEIAYNTVLNFLKKNPKLRKSITKKN